MIKKQLVIIAMCALISSCADPNYRENNIEVSAEENQPTSEAPPLDNTPKINKIGDLANFYANTQPDKIMTIESGTSYDDNFNATQNVEVRNNCDKIIKAYEVKSIDPQLEFSKKIKAKISPGRTHSTTFKINSREVSGHITFVVSKVIFNDGVMVELDYEYNLNSKRREN